jgi:hypothetical protein
MGRPVIIDDGGSIRIRLALEDPDSAGVMDSLFEPGANEHEIDDSYTNALFFWLDKNGVLTPKNIANFDTILVSSDFGLDVEAKKSGAGSKLKLKVSGQSPGPIIESKQHKKKRSYNVVNGGRIKKISVDGATFHTLNETDIYGCVVIT